MTDTPDARATAVEGPLAVLGESPVWDERAGVVWWLDVTARRLHAHHLDGRATATTPLAELVTAVGLTMDDRLLAATRHGLALLDPVTGALSPVASVPSPPAGTRCNDLLVAPDGSAWVGTMAEAAGRRDGALLRLTGGRLHPVLTGLDLVNGIDIAPDGRTLYVVDSRARVVLGIDPSAPQPRPRTVIDLSARPALPDGLAVDAVGRLWVALWGGGEVRAFTPDGRPAGRVRVDVPLASSCCFAGPDLGTLVVTTAAEDPPCWPAAPGAGGLRRARPGAVGRPPARWAPSGELGRAAHG